ncbi:MAG: hypothetical protein JW864_13805 [Spirochaetes bacterium]|nr:hypothetical protein [Spirochaetota bacterium]
MNFSGADIYTFLRGPAFLLTVIVFTLGCIYRVTEFVQLTYKIKRKKIAVFSAKKNNRALLYKNKSVAGRLLVSLKLKFRRTIFSSHPVISTISLVFHILLFITPVFLPSHNILANQEMGISLFFFPGPVMDKLTIVIMAVIIFFLFRRIFVSRVRLLTTVRDYFVLLIVLAPFVTGFAAYHQFFYYKTVLLLHMAIGEIAIMAVPFTAIGHMPFLIFSRFFIGNEYSWHPGNRKWK